MLTNLVAAAACARLASAIVDYISKGHFREFLFGMEQHSLGEPWPDVLGVTIIIVVSVLFMMGLEVRFIEYFIEHFIPVVLRQSESLILIGCYDSNLIFPI